MLLAVVIHDQVDEDLRAEILDYPDPSGYRSVPDDDRLRSEPDRGTFRAEIVCDAIYNGNGFNVTVVVGLVLYAIATATFVTRREPALDVAAA